MANYMSRGGYGNPWAKGYHGKNIVTVYAPNGVPFQVHREAAPAFQGFVNELAASGYNIRPTDSGGYNLRTKRGGTSTSQHGFGNAIDINWQSNLFSRKLTTDMPANVTEMAAKWGLEWGGNWRGKKDAMHFEWTGAAVMPGVGAVRSKEDIMAAQQSLAAQGLYNGPIDGEVGPLTRQALAALGPGSPASAGAPQTAQSAIASLQPPSGGTQTPTPPSALQGFQPTIPDAAFGTPGQVAITEMLAPAPSTPAPPFVPASGPIGPNFGPMLSPADVLNAGPRPRPAALSPVRPPMPNTMDRNLGVLPPAPMLRPGGAPQAGMVPVPPSRAQGIPDPRMRPSAPQSPVDAFSPSAGPLDLIPYSTQPLATAAPAIGNPPGIAHPLDRANRIVSGQGGPVIPLARDEMLRSRANAAANTERSLGLGGTFGTPETAISLGQTFPPPPVNLDQRIADHTSFMDSRSLAAEMGFDRRMMEWHTQPPPGPPPEARTKDDVFALPGPVGGFDRAAETVRIGGFPPSLNVGAFPPTIADDPYAAQRVSSFDASRPYSGFTPSPTTEAVSAPPPIPAMARYDPLSSAYPPSAAPPAPPPVSYTPFTSFGAAFDELGRPVGPIPTQATTGTGEDLIEPGSQPGAAAPAEYTPYVPPIVQRDPSVAVQDPAVAAAAVAAAQQEEQGRRGFFPTVGRILGIGGGGGSIFGIGPNGFLSNAGSFTPFTGPGAGGTSPFNQQPGGAMGTTTWRHGSVTGNPNMQGTMWNRSGDNGSVGYVTDPFTGSMIYSGSPNRF